MADLTDADLDAIEAKHVKTPDADDVGTFWCFGCEVDWPCDTVQLVAEVRRLRRIEAAAKDVAAQEELTGHPMKCALHRLDLALDEER